MMLYRHRNFKTFFFFFSLSVLFVEMLIFVCFVRLYTIGLYNYGYFCALYVFLQIVKRFEFPKALYKFPIIIIMDGGNGEGGGLGGGGLGWRDYVNSSSARSYP